MISPLSDTRITRDAAELLDAHGYHVVGPLPFRTRAKRAIRWPLTFMRYLRAGCPIDSAWRLTHWTVWYDIEAN